MSVKRIGYQTVVCAVKSCKIVSGIDLFKIQHIQINIERLMQQRGCLSFIHTCESPT